MPRALVTSITGQDGLYLSELLLRKGYEVHWVIRGQNNPKLDLVRERVLDASKARRLLGCEPTKGFEEVVAAMVETDLAALTGEVSA